MDQPLNGLPRRAMQGEFVPDHYFRRFDATALQRDGRPVEIDLGCGDGSFLLGMAERFPERDFLGVERLLGRVRKVCRKITRRNLTNARVLRLESRYTVEWLLPEQAVSRIHLLCPDPWPKLRHHRRRLVNHEFLSALHRALVDDGEFLFMSDHEEYAEWVVEKITGHPGFTIKSWDETDFFYPKTDFQLQWEAEGKSMHRIRAMRIG